jgi:hypothetical protein
MEAGGKDDEFNCQGGEKAKKATSRTLLRNDENLYDAKETLDRSSTSLCQRRPSGQIKWPENHSAAGAASATILKFGDEEMAM